MLEHLRVAVVQCRHPGTDPAENTQEAMRLMDEANKMGSHIVLFPEAFLTGYCLPVTNQQALPLDNPYLGAIQQRARELGLGVVITAFTQGMEKPRNTAWVVGRQGELLLTYHKVHTCDFADEACLESGQEFLVCDFEGVRLGIMICYDREYPESARLLMLAGAEVVLVPNDCGSMAPRLQALSTRAYENMLGVAMANPPGENAGCSCAYSPICWDKEGLCVDNTLLLADQHSSGIFLADFDMEAIRRYRSSEMMGNTFRKVQAYGRLLDSRIEPPFIREGNQ